MAQHKAPKHAVTPPKGRPTHSRREAGRRRTLGSTAQWVVAIAVLVLLCVVIFILLDDKANTTNLGQVVGTLVVGVLSQPR